MLMWNILRQGQSQTGIAYTVPDVELHQDRKGKRFRGVILNPPQQGKDPDYIYL